MAGDVKRLTPDNAANKRSIIESIPFGTYSCDPNFSDFSDSDSSDSERDSSPGPNNNNASSKERDYSDFSDSDFSDSDHGSSRRPASPNQSPGTTAPVSQDRVVEEDPHHDMPETPPPPLVLQDQLDNAHHSFGRVLVSAVEVSPKESKYQNELAKLGSKNQKKLGELESKYPDELGELKSKYNRELGGLQSKHHQRTLHALQPRSGGYRSHVFDHVKTTIVKGGSGGGREHKKHLNRPVPLPPNSASGQPLQGNTEGNSPNPQPVPNWQRPLDKDAFFMENPSGNIVTELTDDVFSNLLSPQNSTVSKKPVIRPLIKWGQKNTSVLSGNPPNSQPAAIGAGTPSPMASPVTSPTTSTSATPANQKPLQGDANKNTDIKPPA
jgi:hypothetical protein